MAAVNPIENAQLCKLFPALTPKQITNLCFYSMGAAYQDVSGLLGATPTTIKKSLESAQKYFNVGSLPELKTAFWARFVFRQICNKYGIDSERFMDSIHQEEIAALRPIFPELNKYQLSGAVLHSIGFAASEIATKSRFTAAQIDQLIREAVVALEAGSELLLRMLITSRFINDLC